MKTFLKMLLAVILGFGLFIFIGFIFMASLVSLSEDKVEVSNHSVLKINVNTMIRERVENNPFAGLSDLGIMSDDAMGLNNLKEALKEAANDDRIEGVYLNGAIPIAGTATLAEFRNALGEFKESGKFIYNYSEVMSQKGLYLVSIADSVLMNPAGFVEWTGLNGSVTYYKEALDKLGVKPVVLRATGNKYKSAVEPFLRQDMSVENRAQLTDLLGSFWGQMLATIGEARNITSDKLNALADSMTVTSSVEAMANNMIDGTVYYDQVQEALDRATNVGGGDWGFISVKDYLESKPSKTNYKADKIAVIVAQGEIVSGDGGEYSIGSDRIAKAIRDARTNDKVKAIVLRVNSPGGSALASEVIWREVQLAKEVKPLVASMGDVAASGGYYISCLADTIVAQPSTVTGSIGVFGLFFTAQELMNEKLGINIETVPTNHYADLGTLDRDLTPGEIRMLISQVDEVYTLFKQRVADGRNLDVDFVNEVGGGHVYSGVKALELGLVDVLGGLDDAIEIAKNMAGIEGEYRVVEYPKLEDPLQKLLKELGGDVEAKFVKSKLGENARYFDFYSRLEKMQGYQARLEYDLIID